MSSVNVKKFFNFVKECKTNKNTFYILQGRMFDDILTNKIFKDNLKFQLQYKSDDYDTDNHDNMPDCFIKDENALAGCVCWISQDGSFVKVYKIKDINVTSFSYEMVLIKILFNFGIAVFLEKNKSVKDHFVCLELLKYCLIIAEGLELPEILQNIKAIAFSCFLSQVTNVFKSSSKANFRQVNKELVKLKKNFSFSFSSSKVSQSQVSLHDLQVYLSFIDGYANKIINLKEWYTQYQPSYFSPFMSTITFIKELVMYCDLLLFVQCLNAKQLHIFRQTYCSKEIYKVCETEFYEDVINTKQSSVTILTTALACFDWLIELVCSCIFASTFTNEFNDTVVTDFYLNNSLYNKLQLGDYVYDSNESLREKHKQFFQSSLNMITLLRKVFLVSVLESTLSKCFKSHNRFCSTYEREKIIMTLVNLAFILKSRLIICLTDLMRNTALDELQDCFLNKYDNILGDKMFQRLGKLLHIVVDKTKSFDNLFVNSIVLSTFLKVFSKQLNLSSSKSTIQRFASIEFPFGSTNFRIEKKDSSQKYLEIFFLMDEVIDKKQHRLLDLATIVLNSGSSLGEDFIARESKKIIEEKKNLKIEVKHQYCLKERFSYFDKNFLLKEKIWMFVLIVPKFINYTYEPDKAVNLMENFFISVITFPEVVGWSNLKLIVFEGWLIMIRYLINNNLNFVELVFESLYNFFECLNCFIKLLKDPISLIIKDCFFKLITCIHITLKKVYIIYNENFTSKLKLTFLDNYLSIVETISKMHKEVVTFKDISNVLNHFFTTLS